MPNVMKVFREEIARISRKEAKAATDPIRKPSVRYRKDIADLKRRMALIEKLGRELLKRMAKTEAAQPTPPPPSADKGWITGKGIKSLRRRLGLSQSKFARLIGVSDQAAYMWERKSSMLKLRPETKAKVMAARLMGAKEAKQRLAELKAAGNVVKGKRVRKTVARRGKRTKK